MKRNLLKKALAGLLSAALLVLPTLAAEPQQPSSWAVSQLADSYALGLVDDNYTTYIQSPVTMEQLESIMDPKNFVGRAPQQTEEFIQEVVQPILDENKDILGMTAEINV